MAPGALELCAFRGARIGGGSARLFTRVINSAQSLLSYLEWNVNQQFQVERAPHAGVMVTAGSRPPLLSLSARAELRFPRARRSSSSHSSASPHGSARLLSSRAPRAPPARRGGRGPAPHRPHSGRPGRARVRGKVLWVFLDMSQSMCVGWNSSSVLQGEDTLLTYTTIYNWVQPQWRKESCWYVILFIYSVSVNLSLYLGMTFPI